MRTLLLTIFFGPMGFLFGINNSASRNRHQKLLKIEKRQLRIAQKRLELEKTKTPKQYKDYKGFWDWLNG